MASAGASPPVRNGRKRKADATAPGDEDTIPCGICFDEVVVQGVLNSCRHVFCFDCIRKWATRKATCPQCLQRFDKINKVWYEGEARKVKKYRVRKKDGSPAEPAAAAPAAPAAPEAPPAAAPEAPPEAPPAAPVVPRPHGRRLRETDDEWMMLCMEHFHEALEGRGDFLHCLAAGDAALSARAHDRERSRKAVYEAAVFMAMTRELRRRLIRSGDLVPPRTRRRRSREDVDDEPVAAAT